jgi:hypothetical protein
MTLLDQILPILTSTPARWTTMFQTYPAELVTRKPAPSEWSAVECLVHILESEPLFNHRLHAFLAGEPTLSPFSPGSEETKAIAALSPAAMAARFAELRAGHLKALRGVTAGDLARTSTHTRLGPLTLANHLSEWAAHDLSHTVQAEEAMMQPLIESAGPFHIFFEAHKVKAVEA